jgi:Mg2+ and Co2+ transporter CorA
MEVRHITDTGVAQHPVEDLKELLARDDGFVWVDIPCGDEAAKTVLSEVFALHPLAVRDCLERNRVARVHPYQEHVFIVLHAPELGSGGHVHYLELDQIIGPRYLLTVHGPINEAVDPAVAERETRAVARRLDTGKLRPTTPFELSYSIVSALSRHKEAFVEQLTQEVWALEQRVTSGHMGDPEQFLDEMFRARHGLLAVRTMAAVSIEAYARMATFNRAVPAEAKPVLADIVDQFERVRSIADGEKEYLQGVIEFYRARAETKMTIAAERLAVIAVITLPITALSSIYGMNIIVNDATHVGQLIVVLSVMAAMSVLLLIWAKRQGWF